MVLSTAQAALKAPNAEAITAVIMKPTDPQNDGAEVLVPIADAAFWTSDVGANRNLAFKNAVAENSGVVLNENLTKSGQLTGDSEFKAGRIVVDADAAITSLWPTLDWNGKSVEIFVGARRKADGAEMDLSEFDATFTGLIDKMRPLGDAQFEVTFADLRLEFDKDVGEKVYRGFGGGFRISGDIFAPSTLFADHTTDLDVTNELTLVWIGTFDGLRVPVPSSAHTPFIMNGKNGISGDPVLSVNYALMVNDLTGTLVFAGGLDGSNISTAITSSYLIPVGQPLVLAAVVAADGVSVTFYAGTDGDDVAEVDTGTLPFPVTPGPLDGVSIGQTGGSDMSPWEVQVWDSAKSLEDLRELADGPVTDANDRSDLLESWRFSEGVKLGLGSEAVFGEKGVLDFAASGTPTWVSSYTGDDPDIFAGSVAGKTRALAYGPVSNVLLARIDTQRHVYGWDTTETDDLTQLRQRGVPMVLDQSLTSVAGGDLVFNEAARTVTIVNTPTGFPNFSKFIPGQLDPARLGQRVEILGGGANVGIYRVAVDGISEDGLTMTLDDKAVTDESAPAGTIIRSYEPDVQYELDLTKSVVTLLSQPDGDITADIVGRLPASGFARWSELFEMITGIAPDQTSVVFDPVLGFFLKPDAKMTVNKLLDELAAASFGWWVEDGAGGYRIGNFAPPSGTPVEVVSGSEILDVEPLNSILPFWRFNVGYQRIWHVQSGDRLATSVSAQDAQRFGEEFTFACSIDRTVLETYPMAVEHPGFKTWMAELADVDSFIALAEPMLSVGRKWHKLRFGSFWALNIQLNDVIEVTWEDDPTLELITTACRVVGRQINTGDYSMTLEVHT